MPLLHGDVQAGGPVVSLLVLDVELLQSPQDLNVSVVGRIVEAVETLLVGTVKVDPRSTQY